METGSTAAACYMKPDEYLSSPVTWQFKVHVVHSVMAGQPIFYAFLKLWHLWKAPPPCVATQGHPQDNESDQRSLSCTPSLHWLAPCTCKSHGGRARYVSGSASFHILSDLLTHIHILTCSAGKDQISICLHAAFWSLSGFRPHKRWTHIKAHACKRHYVPAGG